MSLDIYLETEDRHELFHTNITHNLNIMAQKAALYYPLWRPEEIGITTVTQLVGPLTYGIAKLTTRPSYFKMFDAANGWGTYDQFLPWLRNLLAACERYPKAFVRASR